MILCCGEALIDLIAEAAPEGGFLYRPHAGGGVFNTAVALGRLGQSTGFWSGLSQDGFGALLRAHLDEAGVSYDLITPAAFPTTLAVAMLENGQARYSFYDEGSAGRMLSPEALPTLPQTVDVLFFGGISLVNPPAADAYEALCAREAGRRVIVIDPNIRAGFIRDEAAYRARLKRMLGMADVVKLSDEDLAWLIGEGDIAAQAAAVLALGPQLLLITRGAEGVSAYRLAQAALHQPAVAVAVVDTVGAGDTFNAGVMAALAAQGALRSKAALGALSDAQLQEALAFGVKVAAVTVSRAGANPPWRSEL